MVYSIYILQLKMSIDVYIISAHIRIQMTLIALCISACIPIQNSMVQISKPVQIWKHAACTYYASLGPTQLCQKMSIFSVLTHVCFLEVLLATDTIGVSLQARKKSEAKAKTYIGICIFRQEESFYRVGIVRRDLDPAKKNFNRTQKMYADTY